MVLIFPWIVYNTFIAVHLSSIIIYQYLVIIYAFMTVTVMGDIFYHLIGKDSGCSLVPFKILNLNYLIIWKMWELYYLA